MAESHTPTNGSDYRAFPRHFLDAIVRFRIDDENDIYSATLNDYSKGGLRLVTGFPLPRDALINIETPLSEIAPEENIYPSPARVLWSKPFSGSPQVSRYGSGSRWLAYRCNWCNEPVAATQIYRTEDDLWLCPRCREEMEKHCNRRIKHCVRRFLLGNVL